jgi:hypothetical protein
MIIFSPVKITLFWDVTPCSLVESYQKNMPLQSSKILTFREKGIYSYLILYPEDVFYRSSDTSVSVYKTGRRHVPDDIGFLIYRCENLKSYLLN